MHGDLLRLLDCIRRAGAPGFILGPSVAMLLLVALAVACTSRNSDDVIGIAVTQTLEAAAQAASIEESNGATATPASAPQSTELEGEAEEYNESDSTGIIAASEPTYGNPAPVPPGAIARLGRGSLTNMALSPDGRSIAIGGSLGVFLYDSETLEEKWSRILDYEVLDLAFSPDSRSLAVGVRAALENAESLRILDTSTGSEILSVGGARPGSNYPVASLAWSSMGDRLATASGFEKTVILWDTNTGAQVATLERVPPTGPAPDNGKVIDLAFSPDGDKLAAAYEDPALNEAVIWNVKSRQQLHQFRSHNNDIIHVVEWSPNGKVLATGSVKDLYLWDTESGQLLRNLERRKPLGQGAYSLGGSNYLSLAFTPDSYILAAGEQDGQIARWDLRTGDQQLEPEGHRAKVVGLAWADDGATLISAGMNDTLIAWDAKTNDKILVLDAHTSHASYNLENMAWSPNGELLAIAAPWSGTDERIGGNVVIWDVEAESIAAQIPARAFNAAWSPDGRTLASGSPPLVLRNGETFDKPIVLGKDTFVLANGPTIWSPSGEQLASIAYIESDPGLAIWDHETGVMEHHIKRAGEYNQILIPKKYRFSPDATELAVIWNDEIVSYDTQSGTEHFTIEQVPLEMDWSSDGHWLYTVSEDGQVSAWDGQSGVAIDSWKTGYDKIALARFSPDSRLIALNVRGKIVVWDVGTTQLLETLPTFETDIVLQIAWSPDGQRIAGILWDETVIVWDVQGW